MKILLRTIPVLAVLCLRLSEADGQTDSTHVPKTDSTVMAVPDSLSILPDAILLDEAVILPYRTYTEFKQAFLNHDSQSAGATQAKKNMNIVQQQINLGVTPEMNAYENFRNRVTYNLIRPQGFVIISTSPNQGIVPLVKKVMGK